MFGYRGVRAHVSLALCRANERVPKVKVTPAPTTSSETITMESISIDSESESETNDEPSIQEEQV